MYSFVVFSFLYIFYSTKTALIIRCLYMGGDRNIDISEARGTLKCNKANKEFVIRPAILVVLYEVVIYKLGITFRYHLLVLQVLI